MQLQLRVDIDKIFININAIVESTSILLTILRGEKTYGSSIVNSTVSNVSSITHTSEMVEHATEIYFHLCSKNALAY